MLTETIVYRLHVRHLLRRDMAEAVAISAATPKPWTESDFLQELRKRNNIGMVVETGDHKIVGYMIYELQPKRIDLLTLAVHPSYRRRGVGLLMTVKLTTKLAAHRRTEIVYEARESHLGTLQFLRAVGMCATRIIRGHFADTGEDAFTMRLGHDGGVAC